MARPNSPDMPPKRTKKVRLGIKIKPPNNSKQQNERNSDVYFPYTSNCNIVVFKKGTKGKRKKPKRNKFELL